MNILFYIVLKNCFFLRAFCDGHEIQMGVDVSEYREMVNALGSFGLS